MAYESEWQTVPIESLCEGIYDGPHATPPKTSAGPLFLGISALNNGRLSLDETEHLSEEDFAKWTRRVTPREDDLVFSYETRLGQAALIPAGLRCCLGRRMGLMRINRAKADPAFLLYAYLAPEFQETLRARTVHGSTVPRIPLIEFGSFPIRVPGLEIQRAVAEILSVLDRRLDLLNETNETLEAIARAVFKSWFVDFDPVRAKAEGREPEGMDAATAALFPNEFKDSELGPIPSGWQWGQLSDLVEVNPTRTLRKGETAPYLDMSNVPTAGPSISDIVQRPLGSGCKFINGDTLLAKITPCLENGKTAFVDFLQPNEVGWGSTELIVLAPVDPVPPVFGYLVARDKTFRSFAEKSMTGTSGRQRVPPEQLKRFGMVIAEENIYRAFGAVVTLLFDAISANAKRMKTLSAVRDTLLPRLISGKLRMPEAEAMVAEAL